MAGIKIVDLPALGRDLAATDLLELSLAGGTGSRKITGQEIINASKLNVGTTPIINGTAGRLLFQSTGNTLQQSSSLSYDIANDRLIVGSTGSSGVIAFPTTTSGFSPIIQSQFGGNNIIFSIGGRNFTLNGGGGITTTFNTTITGSTGSAALVVAQGNSGWTPVADFNGSSGTALRVNTNGNVLIGTTTDAGFKLDVNGTARIVNALTLGNVVLSLSSQGNGTISSGNSVGNPTTYITLSGPVYYNPTSGTAGTFAVAGQSYMNSGTAQFNTLTVAPIINNSGTYSGIFRGFYYNPTLTSLTGTTHRAIETTTGDVLLGTTSGNVGIGTSSPLQRLHVNGNGIFGPGTAGTSYIQFSDGSVSGRLNRITFNDFDGGTSTRGGWLEIGVYNGQIRYGSYNQFFIGSSLKPYRFFMKDGTDNVIISNGTAVPTDSGYLFDVQGTARVSGILTIGDNVQGKISADNQYLNLYHNGGTLQIISFGFGSSIGASGYLRINQNAGDPAGTTSGTIHRYDFNSTITNSSGTAQWNFQSLRPNYNFTGTYSGTVRGFYYNPTLTSMTGVTHFAFHSTSGRVRFEGLPTSPTGLNAGDLWNDAGTLKIV